MILRRFVPVLLLALAYWPAQALGQEPSLEPFLGTWKGVGLTEKFNVAGYFTYTKRDLDVGIQKTEKGFDITWVTGLRADESIGVVTHRKTTTLSFTKTGPGLFEAGEAPPWSKSNRWARLADGSLIIYIFEVDTNGIYELSRYVRTITAPGEMDLGFTRDLDGRPVRQVTAQLKRTGD